MYVCVQCVQRYMANVHTSIRLIGSLKFAGYFMCIIHLSLQTAHKMGDANGKQKRKDIMNLICFSYTSTHTNTPYKALFARITSNLIQVYLFYSLLLTLFLSSTPAHPPATRRRIEYVCLAGLCYYHHS